MALKDLTGYLAPNLEIPYAGKTYVVLPPTKDTGLKLAAVNAMGVATYTAHLDKCPTCGRDGAVQVPQSTLDLIDEISDVDLARLSLGEHVYREMVEDGVPGPHIDTFGLYAMYYWVLGEEVADQVLSAKTGGGAPGGASSGSSTSKRGPRTASERRTQRRASSPGTSGSPRI